MSFDFRSLLADGWERARCWVDRGMFFSLWHYGDRILCVVYDTADGEYLASREFTPMVSTYGGSRRRAVEMNDFIRRAQAARSSKKGPVRCEDPEFAKRWPALHAFLTDCDGEKGQLRLTSTFTLFADGGVFKCFFNDKEMAASFCLTGETVFQALDAVEAALASGKAPWRFEEQVNGRRAKRKT